MTEIMTDDESPTEHDFGRHETTRRTAIKTLAASGLAGVAFTGTAMADTPERVSLEGAGFPNPCTEEWMEVTQGYLQYNLNARSDGAGGFHLNGHLNLQGVKAEDSEGVQYQLNGAASVNANVKDPQETVTAILNLVVTSQGSEDNLQLRLRVHITVNANGDPTVERFEFIGKCV
ncbi:MAG: hypothetical protein ABEJ22_08340 [Haloferacaceae archaeon]